MMKWAKRKEGIATIWVAVVIMMLVAFVALAMDTGYMVWVGQQLQIGADAAALAGAQKVRQDETLTRLAAITVAYNNYAAGEQIWLDANGANAPSGDIVLGRFDRDTGTFDPASPFRNAVLVNARRTGSSIGGPVDLLFGSILGFDTSDIGRQAIAMTGGGTGTGLLILDNDAECALTVRGDPIVDLGDGSIIVKSDNDCGTCYQGSPDLLASDLYTYGGVCVTGNDKNMTFPEAYEYQDPGSLPDDPLYPLPAPPYDEGSPLAAIIDDSGSPYSPGYYPDGIALTGGNVVLDPGIYILDGAGLDIRGNTNFTAEGVMFYLIGTGIINLAGTGDITITPPDPDEYSYPGVDTYEGVSVFQAYDNTNEGKVLGTSNMNLEGTYYFPRNKLNIGGDSTNFGNQFIAWQAEIFGNGTITLAADGTIPAPGNRVFLIR